MAGEKVVGPAWRGIQKPPIEKAKSFRQIEAELVKSINGSDGHNYYVLHVLMDSQRRIAEYARTSPKPFSA